MADRPLNKFEFVDALRGLAIMEVVLNHTALWVPHANGSALYAHDGTRGVELFFVVSGFSLCLSYGARRLNEQHPTRNFYLRRIFRLAPMFYLAILFYWFLAANGISYGIPGNVQWWQIPLNLLFLHGWLPETINSFVPGGWSMAVTFTFSLLVPVLYPQLKDIRKSVVLFLIISALGYGICVLAGTSWSIWDPSASAPLISEFTEFWFFGHLPAFGAGILVYQLTSRAEAARNKKLGYVLFLVSVIVIAANMAMSDRLPWPPREFLYAIAFGVLALALFHAKIAVIVNPVICWIGRISYSMYFIHWIVFLAWRSLLSPQGFRVVGTRGLLVDWFIAMAVTCALSWITNRWIERPFMRLGSRLIRRLETPAPVTGATALTD